MSKEQSIIIKGVAILMMLFYHLFFRTEINELCNPIIMIGDTSLVYYISRICYPVTFFLILSGYGLTYLYKNGRLGIKSEIKRLSKLYLTYWIVLLIFVTLAWFIKHDLYKYDLPHIIGNLTAVRCNYNGETWFLFPYAMISLTSFWIIRLVYNLKKIKWTICTIVIYSIAFLIADYMGNNLPDNLIANIVELQIVYYIILNIYFLLGIILYKLIENRVTFGNHTQPFYIVLLIILFIAKSLFKITILDGIYALLFIILFINLQLPLWINKVLHHLGRQSMVMWMTHTFFCYYLFEDFIYSFKYPLLIFIALIIICYLTAIPITKISNSIIKNKQNS